MTAQPGGVPAAPGPPEGSPGAKVKGLWSRSFLLLVSSAVLAFGNIYVLVPTLPTYVEKLGGDHTVLGVAMALFNVTALLVRPWSGWLVDRFGARLVLTAGAGLLGLVSLTYLLASDVNAALLVRALHGVGWGLFTVAGPVMAADMALPGQRGNALSIYGMSGGLALAFAPMVGTLLGSGSYTFLAGAAAGLIALGFTSTLRPPTTRDGKGSGRPLTLVSRPALLPAGLLLIFMATYGAIYAFVPVLTVERQLGGPAWFFTPYAIAMFLLRSITGRLSDRYGRARIVAPGMVCTAVALALLGASIDQPTLVLSALIYAGGMAAIQPITLAWATDRAASSQRGAAIATAVAAQDIGISGGSFVAGIVADSAGLGWVFGAFAGLAAIGVAVAVLLDTRGYGRSGRRFNSDA